MRTPKDEVTETDNNAQTTSTSTNFNFPGNMQATNPTVSGFSAGGYMSMLLHTIHSGTFQGAASIAGGAYASPYVNSGQKSTRKRRQTETYSIQESVNLALQYSNSQQIDNKNYLEASKVFILHANNDESVPVYLAHEIWQYYGNITNSNVVTFQDIGRNFGHSFPTDNSEPAQILNALNYGTLTGNYEMVTDNNPTIESFDITQFCPNNDCNSAYMSNTAYLAASQNCKNGNIVCPVHIYLHGCGGSVALTNNQYELQNTYYANLAEAYDLIVIFPQVGATGSDQEERGSCWNVGWYETPLESSVTGHLTYENPHAQTLKNLVDSLMVAGTTTGPTTLS